MINKTLMLSTILNFMHLSLDMQQIFNEPYSLEWREPEYNFYVKKYQIIRKDTYLWINWINLNDESHTVQLFINGSSNKLWNKIQSLFHKQIQTTDKNRVYNVITQVVFPDFCKELNITTDFDRANTTREAADLVLCFIYQNYFESVPIEKFIEMFNLRNLLTNDSILYIKNNVVSDGSV